MKSRASQFEGKGSQSGTVLIIVLWVSLGLVSVTLIFGHSMFFEFKAADNSYAGRQAEQTIEGAIRYVQYVLANQEELVKDAIIAHRELDRGTYESIGLTLERPMELEI